MLVVSKEKAQLYQGDNLAILKTLETNSIDSVVQDPPAGIGFMGRDWDKNRGGRAAWIAWMASVQAETYRVAKPGAYALTWALPRTSHWTAMALEDAGWEIVDVLTHLNGQGFPKTTVWTQEKAAKGDKEARTMINAGYEGWGRGGGLKPCSEHWILTRKAISEKNIAQNVLKWGTGALNITAGRVSSGNDNHSRPTDGGLQKLGGVSSFIAEGKLKKPFVPVKEGRFPPNFLLSHTLFCLEEVAGWDCIPECPVFQLDLQSGFSKSPEKVTQGQSHRQQNGLMYSGKDQRNKRVIAGYNDSGGASRFYPQFQLTQEELQELESLGLFAYFAKPSPSEKDYGLKDSPFENDHPTVKSIALMKWLSGIVTPASGTCLDPFMGTATTGLGALENGFRFIGMEQSPDYFKIAQSRIDRKLKDLKAA